MAVDGAEGLEDGRVGGEGRGGAVTMVSTWSFGGLVVDFGVVKVVRRWARIWWIWSAVEVSWGGRWSGGRGGRWRTRGWS